jgi:hypothetical protein
MGDGKFATAWDQAVEIWAKNTGRIVILGMVVIALLAALYAQWHLYFDSRRALEYYGADASTLVQQSDHLDLLYLAPVTPELQARRLAEITILDETYVVTKMANIDKAPGVIHARTALLSDSNYDWISTANGSPNWVYAFQFRKNKSTAIVAFSPGSSQAILVGGKNAISIAPIAPAIERFRRDAEAEVAARTAGNAASRAVRER